MKTPAITRRQFIVSATSVCTMAAVGGGTLAGSRVLAQAKSESPGESHEAPRLVPTLCGMCDANCGVLAYVRGQQLDKLEGNHSHSHSAGRICARGSAGVKLLYDPDRLQQPQKRVADGQYQAISWEQAFTEIGERLSAIRQAHGPQSLAWVRRPDASDDWDRQFAAAFGTPNLFSCVSLGQSARIIASSATTGWLPVADLRHVRYVLIFGRNHGDAIFPADLDALMAAKEAGAKIVVIDPRLSSTASQAHEWLPIRPGTDGALLLALINVLINENLYDHTFVESYVDGFEELRAAVAEKTPAWAATETEIPSSTIVRLARELAAAKPLSAVDPGCRGPWGGLYANSLDTARAALILNGLLGAFGAAGTLKRPLPPAEGNGRFQPPATPPIAAERVDGAQRVDPALLPQGDGFVHTLPEAIISGQPYPIKALVVRRSNPALSWPNSRKVLEALRKLDLLVAIDVLPSDTTALAHYILPESTYLERSDPPLFSRGETPELALRQEVVRPRYDTRPPAEIITGLAKAAGLQEYFQFSAEDVANARIGDLKVNRAQLVAFGVWKQAGAPASPAPRFDTPSGKMEIRSERLKAAGFNEIPGYAPPANKPAAADSFRLLTGRGPYHTGSSTQNNGWLHARAPENRLLINADRAVRLGIGEGDLVVVRSEVGSVQVRAHVTQGIHPQAVFLQHGFGARNRRLRLAAGRGANDNELVVDRIDPADGSAATAETIVRVAKA